MAIITLYYSPKGSSINKSTREVPLLVWLLLPLLISGTKIIPSLRPKFFSFIVRWGGGRIYLLKKVGKTWFFFLFLMCLAIRGFFFQYKTAINRARRAKLDLKIDTFCRIGICVLEVLEVEKVLIFPFSKLMGKFSCFFHFFCQMCLAIRGNDFDFFLVPTSQK